MASEKQEVNIIEQDQEELEFLDDAIIYAWENGQQEFVNAIEQFLLDFIDNKEINEEMIGNVNKFQRKVIHQLCERCNIARTYVDIKNNSENANITIQKSASSEKPQMKVAVLYEKLFKRTMQKQKQAIEQQQQIQKKYDPTSNNQNSNATNYDFYFQQQQQFMQQMQQMNPFVAQMFTNNQNKIPNNNNQPLNPNNYNLGINKIEPSQQFKPKKQYNNSSNRLNSEAYKPKQKIESPLDKIVNKEEEFPSLV